MPLGISTVAPNRPDASDRSLETAQLPFDSDPQVLNDMEAISDLAGLRCSAFGAIGIETVPIAGDELYLRMISQPCLSACCRAVG